MHMMDMKDKGKGKGKGKKKPMKAAAIIAIVPTGKMKKMKESMKGEMRKAAEAKAKK